VITGKGAKAIVRDRTIFIGSPKLFREISMDFSQWQEKIARLQEEGKTVLLVGTRDEILGGIGVADTLRESTKEVIRKLRNAGVQKTIMLTGDNNATAKAIAKSAGVDDFIAELLPQDKVAAVNNIREKYGKVAMVGDGINDTPALAAATVGIAMGNAGTDTALETADIVLKADDLAKLPFAMKLSRAALKVIKQNICFSIVIKLVAVMLVFPRWLTLWLAITADMGASVLVTLNRIRLMAVK